MTKNKLNLRIWPRLKIGQGKYDFTLQPKSEAELKQRKEDGMKISLSGIKRKIHFICDLIPKSLLLQLEAGRNFETFIVEYFRHRAHFKH